MPNLHAWLARNRRGLEDAGIVLGIAALICAELDGVPLPLAFAAYITAPVVAHLAGRVRRARKGGAA